MCEVPELGECDFCGCTTDHKGNVVPFVCMECLGQVDIYEDDYEPYITIATPDDFKNG